MDNETKNTSMNPKSYWIDSTPSTGYPALKEDLKVDVAVIGGGIVGITTAMLLKEQGVKVAILEAGRIAEGTSGYTTAKLTSQHHLTYDIMTSKLGIERAKQLAEANETAIQFIADTIEKHGIDCDFQRMPAYMYTEKDEYVEQIQREVEASLKLGLKARYLDSVPLPFSVKAALCFENQAQFHPRKYLLPLAEKIPGDGSFIFENTRVVDVEDEESCTVTTESGKKVACSRVVIASHFPCYDGKGLYFTRLFPDRSYVLGVEAKGKFPQGMFINAEEPGRSLRSQRYKDGEMILVGGEGHKTAHGERTSIHYENLKSFAEANFDVTDIPYRWSTQDYMTPDGAPYAGFLTSGTNNLYVATGFGKWGMTNGTAAAILLKDLITKGESPWQDVFDPSRFTPGASTKKFLVENLDVAKELIGGKAKPATDNIDIAKGEGKIIEIDGSKYGAYRDEFDTIHLVDTTCTHMGCELKWNDAEKSWDCPCHGSRFSYEGEILEGPAVHPLNHYHDEPNNIEPNVFE